MADRLADDVISRLASLQMARSGFERAWWQVRAVAAPEAMAFQRANSLGLMKGMPKRASAAEASKVLFDSTAINAVDRLASGIEALVTPQSEYWHGLGITDFTREELTDAEQWWLERQRNLMFKVRYDADTGFVAAMQTAYRRVVAFGNAFMFVDEDMLYRTRAITNYRLLPLAECYVATDHLDIVNTFYRHYMLTAEQAAGKFREKTPKKVLEAANNLKDKDKEFVFVQCIHPRDDFGHFSDGVNHSQWASFHIFEEDRSIIRNSGYFEFPVIDFRWLPEPGNTYGEGPAMKCVADIQSLQQMAKNEMMAGEQAVRPSLLVANAGVMNRPDARPGGITFGGINPNGQRMVEPLFSGQRLDFHTMVIEAKRQQVKESFFLNLFQLLVKNPQMTAHEAMIRAGEKGELLGPAGSRFQQSLSRMIDRETGILTRRGLYDEDSAYRVPDSLQGKDVTAQMTSPLDRLRRAKEGEGILRVLEVASPLAQVDPTVLDNIDPDTTFRQLRDIFGAPVNIIRDPKAVEKIRADRAQQQAMANNAAIAEQMAKASKQGTDALAGMKEAGAL